MTRLKSFGNLSRAPNAAAQGALKTPRKLGPTSVAPKSILKKPKTGVPVERSIKKKKQRKVVVEEPESDDDEDAAGAAAAVDDDANLVEQEAVEDEVPATDNDDAHSEADATKPKKARKVNYNDRRLRRIALLQKSDARLATKAGFKRIVNHIQSTSETGSLSGAARFTKDALQNLQAAVESLLHKVLSNTAQQVYTITNRKARIDAKPVRVTAEQCLLGMKGAQFFNDYRDARNM